MEEVAPRWLTRRLKFSTGHRLSRSRSIASSFRNIWTAVAARLNSVVLLPRIQTWTLAYALVASGLEIFEMSARDGVLTYVGSGEDFEVEPNEYDLTARAHDPFEAAAQAQVVVTVSDINEPPVAVDDKVSTAEDQSVSFDALANDTDPDGDHLYVESISSAANGTVVIVADGTLEYTPRGNYYGTDRFTYVAADGRGETATAEVVVTVSPVNDAPVAAGTVPPQVLDEGGVEVTLDLNPFFVDIDGDALRTM